MTREEEMALRELAAGRCAIQSVFDALGPMSLWSKDALEKEIFKAVIAEREACEKIQFELRERYISQNKTAQAEIMLLTAVYDYAAAIRARGQA